MKLLKRLFKCFRRKRKEYFQMFCNFERDFSKSATEILNTFRSNKLTYVEGVVFDESFKHSVKMLYEGRMTHEDFGHRVGNIIMNSKYTVAGEVLGRNYEDPEDLVNAWLNSSKHKKIILNETFTHIAVAKYKNYITAILVK